MHLMYVCEVRDNCPICHYQKQLMHLTYVCEVRGRVSISVTTVLKDAFRAVREVREDVPPCRHALSRCTSCVYVK